MTLKSISGITAVITGGASGIGRATAEALYAEGANVVLADINTQGLQESEELLRQRHQDAPGSLISVPTDVRSEEDVRILMSKALEINGSIDLVVTSAGIGISGPIDTFAASEMQRLMDINFMGTYHCIQKALPAMRSQGAGHFICLSSVAGRLGNPFLSGYCASKWAVRGFTSAVRAELEGSGIGITTVYPSWVDTPMIHQESESLTGQGVQALLTPQQVANDMLQAARDDQRNLILAPNPDIYRALELYTSDPDLAEQKMGRAVQRSRAQAERQQP
ncbi:MAG TPA: SDR family oxidoreductase [Ktedonobacteraceae bacterium]|nr:SDR family oxidoreductase [Ktedonobacteraceae bacterium]